MRDCALSSAIGNMQMILIIWFSTCLRCLDRKEWTSSERSSGALIESYRLFVADAEDEYFSNYGSRAPYPYVLGFGAPPEVCSLITNRSFERYSELPLELRWERAMAVNACHWNIKPVALRIAMGGGKRIDPAAFCMEAYDGETLLHKIAQGMAVAQAAKQIDDIAEWRLLLAEAVSASAKLSQLERCGKNVLSSLLWFLHTFVVELLRNTIRCYRPFDDILCIWLSELKHAGVDLEAYGADQKASLEFGDAFLYRPVRTGRGTKFQRNDAALLGRVLGLEYGPEPEDWYIFITNPV